MVEEVTKEEFLEHLAQDSKHFKTINEKLEKLATKEDVKEVLEVFKNVKAGAALISGTSRWSLKIFFLLVAIFSGWAVITGGVKGILASLAGWAMSK